MSGHPYDCDCQERCRPQEDCAGCGDGCNPATLTEAERLCWACVTSRNEIQAAMEDDERPASIEDARWERYDVDAATEAYREALADE
jgi:hypothetical protein